MKRLLLLFLLCAGQLAAHQQKEAYTEVLFNPRSGNIEASHRFLLHDAEHAFEQLTGQAVDLLGDPGDQQLFATYVDSHFVITAGNGDRLQLAPIGFEVDGKHFWVYQQVSMDGALCELTFAMAAFQEIWPEQINHINVQRERYVQSLRLSSEKPVQKLQLKDCQ